VTLVDVNNWEERPRGGSDREAARQVARAVAEREQGRRRLNATTTTVSLASVALAGVVAVVLPGSSHAATSTGSKSSSGSSASTGSTSNSGTSSSGSDGSSSGSSSGSSNGSSSSSSNSGLQAPSSGVQSGGSGGGFSSTSGGT
jgi:cellulose 1,4-beta-cellobiosidase